MNRRVWYVLIAVLLTLTLSACGSEESTITPVPTLSSGTQTPQPTVVVASTRLPVAPFVVSFSPETGDELAVGEAITVRFNTAMDADSVEAALTFEPEIDGTLTWTDERTLSYVPSVTLEPDAVLTLTIAETAKDANGLTLAVPYVHEMTVIGELLVTDIFPAPDSENVSVDSSIRLVFNRPVVPLTTIAGTQAFDPLSFTPAVEGTGTWVNTSTYVFEPSEPLVGGQEYLVSLAADTASLDGAQLGSETSWSFATELPHIVSSIPMDGEASLAADSPISVEFSQAMDKDAAEDAFSLIPAAGGNPINGTFVWADSTLQFTPRQALTRGTSYILTVAAGIPAADSNAETVDSLEAWFSIAPLPEVVAFSAQGDDVSIYDGIEITFSAPISSETFFDGFVIEPEADIYAYWRDNQRIVYVSADMDPSMEYTVRLTRNIEDIYGQALTRAAEYSFSTGPLDPSFSLDVPQSVALYNAYGDTIVPVQTVNISELDFELYGLSVADLLNLTGSNSYQTWSRYTGDDDALIRSWSMAVDGDLNTNTIVLTPLANVGTLDPGLYYMTVTSPDAPARTEKHIVVVSDVNVLLKHTDSEALVWVTDYMTGDPVEAATLTVYDDYGAVLSEGETDADGLAEFSFEEQDPWDTFVIQVERDGISTVHLSSWDDGITAWQYDLTTDLYTTDYRGYVYTDRDIYRPEQTVYYKAIIRGDDDGLYSLPEPGTEAEVTILDSNGRQLISQSVTLSDWGTLDGEFTISAEATLGYYSVYVEVGAASTSESFLVAEYEKPEYEVSVEPARSSYLDGDTIRAAVLSSYFFGGDVSNAKVDWNVLATPYAFVPPDDFKYWSFTDYDDYWYAGSELIAEGNTETDDNGTAIIQLAADTSDYPYSLTYSLEATVTDINNQQVSQQASVVVHKSDLYIGVHPEQYVGQVGASQSVNLVALDSEGNTLAAQSLTVVLNQQEWSTVRELSADGTYYWTSQEELTPVMTRTLTTGRIGQATALFTPTEAGSYKITATGVDAEGRSSNSANYLWVAGSTYVNWGRDNNDRIELVADRDSYEVGQSARILVPSPYDEPIMALLTIERGSIIEYEMVEIDGSSDTLVIPIEDAYAPNVYVSLAMVKGMGDAESMPDFKLGYVELMVSSEQQALNIQLTSEEGAELQPGQEVTFDIEVTDYAGDPVQAELALSLVDRAVESLLENDDTTPFEAFYSERGLGVSTSSSWTVSVDRYVQDATDGSKGGGGGDGGGSYVREVFPDTAYWNATVETDEEGHATVSVVLPDSLTTWHLQANGVAGETLFGTANLNVVALLDLMISPSVPRFLVIGDEPVISAVVYNYTDGVLTLDVNLEAAGLIYDDAAQQVEVAAGERVKIDWPAEVESVEEIEMIFSVEGTNLTDAAKVTLPVLHPSTAEFVGTSGTVDGQVVENIMLDETIDSSMGELLITLQPSLASAILDSLDYLESYPYDCTEQTVSRFLPNIVTFNALTSLGLDRPDLEAALPQQVGLGLQRLYNTQNMDGGWGWWSGESSDPQLTAYVLLGLSTAKDAGFVVDEWTQSSAVDYLDSWLASNTARTSAQKDTWAEVLYALDASGNGQLDRSIWLYDEHEGMSHYAKALLALTLNDIDEDATRTTELLNELVDAAILDASGVHWEEDEDSPWAMNTNTRSSAVVLLAIEQLDPENGFLPSAVRWLVSARESDYWSTTQENVWSILALTQHMLNTGELTASFTMSASVNGVERIKGEVSSDTIDQTAAVSIAIEDLNLDDVNQILLEKNGVGELYYSAFLHYYVPAEDIEALDRGIYVTRSYVLPDSDEPVTTATVNDTLLVKLTLVVPRDLHYLVIEDPLPAGCEALDPELDIVSQLVSSPSLTSESSWSDYWAWYNPLWASRVELRDDRVLLFADQLAAGTYEFVYAVQCATPGTYQALPATAYQMYAPDVFGRSDGAQLVIKGE